MGLENTGKTDYKSQLIDMGASLCSEELNVNLRSKLVKERNELKNKSGKGRNEDRIKELDGLITEHAKALTGKW